MKQTVSRRGFIKTGTVAALGLAAPAVFGATRARASETLIVGDMGGAFNEGFKIAFYEEFEKEYGVSISVTTMQPDPIPQYKMVVDTNTNLFDVAMMTPEHVMRVKQLGGEYFASLELDVQNPQDFTPDNFSDVFAGVAVFALAMGYRTDSMGDNPPKNWADFWNTEAFEGRRGLWRSPVTTLEMALLADGVALDDLYPLDVDRAFASLDKIKGSIDIWWTSGAQCTQLLQNGELDMMSTWSTRAQAAINDGAPAAIAWDQGLFNIDGWTIPVTTPKLDLARKFVAFCLDAERQAKYTSVLSCGPTNMKAYDFIDPKLAALLPTTPDHIKGLRLLNAEYWGENQNPLTERFEQWLLS